MTNDEQLLLKNARTYLETLGVNMSKFEDGISWPEGGRVHFHIEGKEARRIEYWKKILDPVALALNGKWAFHNSRHGTEYTLDFGPNSERRIAVSYFYHGLVEIGLYDFSHRAV